MTASELTTKAFKVQTSAAHFEAAAAHSREHWNSKLSQSARGNHYFQAEKHQRIGEGLKRLGK